MPLNITNIEGDGVSDDRIAISLQLPDTNGGSLVVAGTIQLKGSTPYSVTGSPLTIPAAPASGSIYFNVQVDGTSGAATLQQSTAAFPAAINANNRIVYSQTLTSTTTVASLDAGTTPDSPAGLP